MLEKFNMKTWQEKIKEALEETEKAHSLKDLSLSQVFRLGYLAGIDDGTERMVEMIKEEAES